MKKLPMFFVLSYLIIGNTCKAQISTPKLSPHCTIIQEVGFNEITIDYSRPSVRDRVIFGQIVPYDKIWRTGANASTKIKFKDEVNLEGHEIPAGEYALYTIPGKEEWTIIIHTVTHYWGVGKDYKESDDLIRFKVKPIHLNHKIETMAIEVSDISFNKCTLEIKWEQTLIKLGIKIDTDKMVMADIDDKMKGVSQATYYQSAVYYLENDKDLHKALEWINLALLNNEKFWILRHKAIILAKLKRYNEALICLEKSMKLANEAENDEFLKHDEKLLIEWRALLK
jgi:hypothetical protein